MRLQLLAIIVVFPAAALADPPLPQNEPNGYEACLATLASKGVAHERLGSVREGACTVADAVRLTAVATRHGPVALPGRPTMLCSFAGPFAAWVREVGAPLTLAATGQALASIDTGPGLVCRTRNNKPGEKQSEHARGNAIDIAGFVLADKSRIPVKPDPKLDPLRADLLRTLRTSGCGWFTTILGPGSDPSHAEHLHFDLGQHGRSTNYRICE